MIEVRQLYLVNDGYANESYVGADSIEEAIQIFKEHKGTSTNVVNVKRVKRPNNVIIKINNDD